VKIKDRENHPYDLRKVFEKLPVYQLKMSLSKCAFGVTLRKVLSFMIHKEGIENEPDKVKDIIQTPP